MKPEDISFDENLEFYITLPYTNKEIRVVLSDELEASEEALTQDYKKKISDFINKSSVWYEKAIIEIKNRAIEDYKQTPKEGEIELKNLFILFEQQEDELYGLGFRVEFDVEHGCGLKITGNDFEITEIGDADVAFC